MVLQYSMQYEDLTGSFRAAINVSYREIAARRVVPIFLSLISLKNALL